MTVRVWLLTLVVMIWGMVILGGLTRLTGSGLSIVEWQPIMGAMPPLSHTDWITAFEAYQKFPQYQAMPIDLSEFKVIFAWEYFHRLLGRLIGVIFFVPLIWFAALGQLDRSTKRFLGVALLLGAAQGFLGWYMVKSGLIDVPRVSHYRLAAHLSLALFLGSWLIWTYWQLRARASLRTKLPDYSQNRMISRLSWAILGVVALQIVYGAFTAGLRAGYIYNTFPKMAGYWIPPYWDRLDPLWLNFFENETMIQLIHRILGISLTVLIVANSLYVGIKKRSRFEQRVSWLMVLCVVVQVLLGILTLINMVPVPLASLHQAGAVVLLTVALFNVFVHAARSAPER